MCLYCRSAVTSMRTKISPLRKQQGYVAMSQCKQSYMYLASRVIKCALSRGVRFKRCTFEKVASALVFQNG